MASVKNTLHILLYQTRRLATAIIQPESTFVSQQLARGRRVDDSVKFSSQNLSALFLDTVYVHLKKAIIHCKYRA